MLQNTPEEIIKVLEVAASAGIPVKFNPITQTWAQLVDGKELPFDPKTVKVPGKPEAPPPAKTSVLLVSAPINWPREQIVEHAANLQAYFDKHGYNLDVVPLPPGASATLVCKWQSALAPDDVETEAESIAAT